MILHFYFRINFNDLTLSVDDKCIMNIDTDFNWAGCEDLLFEEIAELLNTRNESDLIQQVLLHLENLKKA